MSLLSYIKKFYDELPTATGKPVLGQIVWTPILNLLPHPHVLEPSRVDPMSHAAAVARYTPMSGDHFKRGPTAKLPILNLHLGETEELLAFHAKLRPAVVVAHASATLGGLEPGTPSHHEERRVAVAPIYDLRSDDDPKGFGPILATRVQHLMYPQYFPLAAWKETRRIDGGCALRQGIVRFDRIQFVNPAPPSLRLVPLRLSQQALEHIHAALWAYFHAEPWEELLELKELLREMLPREAKPPA